MYIRLISLALLLFLCPLALASCANPGGLTSWTSLYGTSLANDITITQPVLFDAPSATAQGITIGQGGQLYFDNTQTTLSLSANYIKIGSGGRLDIGSEACPYTQKATITLTGNNPSVDQYLGGNFIGVQSGGTIELHGSKALGQSWTKLSATAQQGATSIQVVTVPNGLTIGDKLVIATTDFDPTENDVVTVTAISGTTISFTPALQWMHYGQITNNVDERAEVGSLTRNILIQGAQQQQYFGGHLMVMSGFIAAHIEGVEFNNMGQDQIARYPVHFHLCSNVPPGTYVKYNSIHDTNFRCVTIHATNGVLVQGNVAYNNLGHCYFLEDGVEMGNTFRGNLAILTKPKDFGQHVGSDMTATGLASFWITNPNNTFEDNAAVGSYVAGYWVETRLGARGLAACLPQWQNLPYNPQLLPIASFKNNSAHSSQFGFGAESTNWDSGDSPAQTCDKPVANWQYTLPDGITLGWTYIQDFTAHHIGDRAFWARVPNMVINNGRFADNYESVEYATSGDHPPYPSQQLIQNSIIVGVSDNSGNQGGSALFQYWDTSLQHTFPVLGVQVPINGIKIYDGPQVILNTVFTNFPQTATRPNDAPIGGRVADQSQVATTNYIQNVQFLNAPHLFYIVDNSMDGGITCNFRDTDGSASGYVGATVLRDFPYYKTSLCVENTAYGVVCPHKYAQMWILDMTANGANNNMIITRSDQENANANSYSSYSLSFPGFSSGPLWRYQPLVSIGSSYLVRFQNHMPSNLVFQLNNAELGDTVTVAVCYPPGTVIVSAQRGYANYVNDPFPSTQPQSSITSLSVATSAATATANSYFYNPSNGIMFLTLQQRNARTDYGNFCPDSGCDLVWINVQFTGSAAAPDCTQQAYSSGFLRTSSQWLSQGLTAATSRPSGILQSILSNAFPTAAQIIAPSRGPALGPISSAIPTTLPITAGTDSPTAAPPATGATSKATTAPSQAGSTQAPTSSPSGSCQTSCGSGLSCCGLACYLPSQYACNANNQLCPVGNPSCGAGATQAPTAAPTAAATTAAPKATTTTAAPQGTTTTAAPQGTTTTAAPQGTTTAPKATTTTTTTAPKATTALVTTASANTTTTTTNTNTCGCGAGLACCGGSCYVPSLYSCFNNAQLCTYGMQACGTQCYAPNLYTCDPVLGLRQR